MHLHPTCVPRAHPSSLIRSFVQASTFFRSRTVHLHSFLDREPRQLASKRHSFSRLYLCFSAV
ncbi:uncharacterized protein K441DRAFT_666865, partial [Cenococcum geophilum 1.58]|uniref:uncharacterized protein n=1 Tax=Cenococcum geophilum 1.58 TaxID=794803 RepID=UPI00358ED34E